MFSADVWKRRFFQWAWFVHAEGTEDHIRGRADVSSARDDWDAVMTAASTCMRVSKAPMVPASVRGAFRRTDAMEECHGVVVFCLSSSHLTLQMASSRPLVPRVAVEAHSLATAQLMGRSSPSSISERAGAPRHGTTHFFPVLIQKKKQSTMSKHHDERDENLQGSSEERTPQR